MLLWPDPRYEQRSVCKEQTSAIHQGTLTSNADFNLPYFSHDTTHGQELSIEYDRGGIKRYKSITHSHMLYNVNIVY
jgi:hypothetical protein